MRSGCSSFVVVCNLSVIFSLRVFSAETHILAYRAKWCFRRLDPRFVKAAAVRSSGHGESSVTEKLHLLQRASPYYKDANGKKRNIGFFDTQEQAAHAVNAAIRRAGLEGKRRTNPVVDGQLVPRERKAPKKRRRDEPAAAAPRRSTRRR